MAKYIDWTLHAIKPSTYISGLCYSIFRLEPYTGCSYGCIYCYARWYRWNKPLYKPRELIRAWWKLARQLTRSRVPPPYFRLSTLTEPFQEALEKNYVLSLDFLRIALRNEVPVIINTKSTLLKHSPWIDIVLEMANKGLVLVQISLTTIDPYTSMKLEPHAPPPWRRLELIEYLHEHRVPVVARIQPLIPGLEEQQLETTREALEHGTQGIIVESIRETIDGLKRIASIIGYDGDTYFQEYLWEPYQTTTIDTMNPLYHPSRQWRMRIFNKINHVVRTYGKLLTLCKEGIPLPDTEYIITDCCQSHLIKSLHSIRKLSTTTSSKQFIHQTYTYSVNRNTISSPNTYVEH